jgi:hypothetical protein
MKTTKFFLIATFCLFVLYGYSQEHLTFKNVPLNGNINNFAKELVKQGFTVKETKGNVITMSGSYINRQCEVLIFASKKANIVWKVAIYLPEETNWYSIKNDYLKLKEQFITKYGIGKSYEFFSDPYYEGDGYEMQAVKLEKCNYIIYWEKPEGNVTLSISKYRQIKVSYEDSINSALDDKEKSEIISNDI